MKSILICALLCLPTNILAINDSASDTEEALTADEEEGPEKIDSTRTVADQEEYGDDELRPADEEPYEPVPGDRLFDYNDMDESYESSPLSIQWQIGRKWYKDFDLRGDFFAFLTEWYILQDFPLKVGPSLSYTKLTGSKQGYGSGQSLSLALRISSFWDFGYLTPYLAGEYTLLSSGSLQYNIDSADTRTRGSLDMDISGYDLIIGVQVLVAGQSYVTLEGSITNKETITLEGRTGTATSAGDPSEVTLSSQEISSRESKRYTSLAVGILLEL